MKNTVLPNKNSLSENHTGMTDLELIKMFQQTKNMNILVSLLDRYERYVVGIAIRLINEAEEIKDIKQELFLKLVEKLGNQQFKSESHVKHWLGRTTKNYIYDKYIRPNHPIATEELPEKFGEFFPQINLELDFEHVKTCIESLRPDQRIYVELKFFGNMENQEISTHMNWPYNKTRGAGDRALRNLKKLLNQTGADFSQYFKDE